MIQLLRFRGSRWYCQFDTNTKHATGWSSLQAITVSPTFNVPLLELTDHVYIDASDTPFTYDQICTTYPELLI